MTLEDKVNVVELAKETVNDYIWEIMRKGRSDIGCGCHTHRIKGKRIWENYFPEISYVVDYEEIPEWNFFKGPRKAYEDKKFRPSNGDDYREFLDYHKE